jgi:hypothetical protein
MHSEYQIIVDRDQNNRAIAYCVYHTESNSLLMRTSCVHTARSYVNRLTAKPGAKR